MGKKAQTNLRGSRPLPMFSFLTQTTPKGVCLLFIIALHTSLGNYKEDFYVQKGLL
jgi:hypothetical protein